MRQNISYLPRLQLGTKVETGEPLLLYGDGLRRHRVLYGLSGYGKSKLLSSLGVQLLNLGKAFACIDPHSDLADDMLSMLLSTGFFENKKAFDRLWYIRFADPSHTVPFNWLKQPFSPQQIAANLLECCKRVWQNLDEGSSVTFENIIQSATTVLCENNRPLTDLARLLSDPLFRESLLANVSDPVVLEFFHTRFDHYGKMSLESTLRRVFLLSFSPPLRAALGSSDNLINFSHILDEGISVIFDLGGLDEQTQRFLGVLLTVGFEMAMLARATQPQATRKPYNLIIDEWFQFLNHSPESLQRLLDLTRKFGMTLTLASQNLSQTRDIRAALQNCLQIAFRLGHDDAKAAATRFTEPFVQRDELPFWQDLLLSVLVAGPTNVQGDEEPTKPSHWETRLKHLPKGHALVHIANRTVEIQTLIVPPLVNQKELTRLKAEYARRLLRPLSTKATIPEPSLEKDISAKAPTPSVADSTAKRQSRRRTPVSEGSYLSTKQNKEETR